MPLPWKKSRTGRVSRFVSDLKSSSSSKHGGSSSLVVETGFPTSLVDLMIKNQDRLKKPSKKNKKLSVDSSSNSVPSSSSSSMNSTMLMVPASPSSIQTLIRNHVYSSSSSCINDDEKIGEVISAATAQPRKKTFLLMFMFNLLLILSLGFGTKKIALLITITAFVLMLVENLISFLKPCQHAKGNLNSIVESVLNSAQPKLETGILEKKNDISLIKPKKIFVDENLGLIGVENGDQTCTENESGALIIAEIQNESGALIIEDNNTKEEIQIELDFDSLRCGCSRWGFLESHQKKKSVTKSSVELIEVSNAKGLKKKTSVKFNPNMLKKCFVPMLRGSKKKKKKISKESYIDSGNESIATTSSVDETLKNRMDVQENEDELEDDYGDEDEELEDDESGDFSQIELETELTPNVHVRKRISTRSWNLLLIPSAIVIILIGLTGGRLVALVVATLIWCLLLTLKGRIAKKNQ